MLERSIWLWVVLVIILVIVLATLVASRGAIAPGRRKVCGGNDWTPSLMRDVLAKPKRRLWHTIRDLGRYIKENAADSTDWLVDKWDVVSTHVSSHGAANFTGTNYVGPKNELTEAYYRKYPPTDAVDFAGMMHDIAYDNIAKAYNAGGKRETAIADGMRADQDLLDRMAQNFAQNRWAATTGGLCVWTLLQLKKMRLIDGLAFIVDTPNYSVPTDLQIQEAAIRGSEPLRAKGSTDDAGTPLASDAAVSPSAAERAEYTSSDDEWAPQATDGWVQMRQGWGGLIAQSPMAAAERPDSDLDLASAADPDKVSLLPTKRGLFGAVKNWWSRL